MDISKTLNLFIKFAVLLMSIYLVLQKSSYDLLSVLVQIGPSMALT